jgi:hypothetical protein
MTMNFADLLTAANHSQTKVSRGPGQWTSAAVETWRAAEREMARMLDAAIALKLDRKVSATDEDLVRRKRAEMDAATAAMKAGK